MIKRKLDGCFFRIQRDGKWENVCFTDLTDDERNRVCEGKSETWLKCLAYHLADRLQMIGEHFDIVCMNIDGGDRND